MESNIVYWRKKNGDLISVDDMNENHLRNVLKMIIRNNQKVQTTCPHNATQALELSGDAANDFNNNYPEDDDYPCDIYDTF
jgi:hypothetical protein